MGGTKTQTRNSSVLKKQPLCPLIITEISFLRYTGFYSVYIPYFFYHKLTSAPLAPGYLLYGPLNAFVTEGGDKRQESSSSQNTLLAILLSSSRSGLAPASSQSLPFTLKRFAMCNGRSTLCLARSPPRPCRHGAG
jgi:hypothetical protein